MTTFLGTFLVGDTVYLEAESVQKYDPSTGTTADLTSVTSQKFRVRPVNGSGTDVTGTQRGSTNNWYGEYVIPSAGRFEFYSEIVEGGKTSRSLLGTFTAEASF